MKNAKCYVYPLTDKRTRIKVDMFGDLWLKIEDAYDYMTLEALAYATYPVYADAFDNVVKNVTSVCDETEARDRTHPAHYWSEYLATYRDRFYQYRDECRSRLGMEEIVNWTTYITYIAAKEAEEHLTECGINVEAAYRKLGIA